MDIDGNTILIAAFGEGEDENEMNTLNQAGAAYVFEPNGSGVWIQKQKLVASDRQASNGLGSDVTLSGNYLAVSSASEREDAAGLNTLPSAGATYVFEKDGTGVWNEVIKLVPSNRASGDSFGSSLSMDGDLLAIGARGKQISVDWTAISSGAAYVFRRDGGV